MLDQIMLNIQETRAKHEFLTFLILKDNSFRCGVVQDSTPKLIMLYDYEKIRDPQSRMRFMSYADKWWWESNQSIPISNFIGRPFDEFQSILTGYPRKSLEQDPIGPTFSIADLYLKRVKKKRIDIVNRSVAPIL